MGPAEQKMLSTKTQVVSQIFEFISDVGKSSRVVNEQQLQVLKDRVKIRSKLGERLTLVCANKGCVTSDLPL